MAQAIYHSPSRPDRQLFQRRPLFQAAAVNGGALLIPRKGPSGGLLVAIHLPGADQLAPLSPVFDKPEDVLERVAEEQPDLVGESPLPQPSGEAAEAALGVGGGIPLPAEQFRRALYVYLF